MIKVLFLYKTPRKQIYEDWKSKIGPDTALYGFNHLKKFGIQADFFDWAFSIANPIRWICYPIHIIAAKTTGIGFNLGQALTLLPILSSYDLIISTMDSAGLPFLLLKKLKLVKKPIIYISVDFIGKLNNHPNKFPFSLYKNLLGYADVIIAYSKEELNKLRKYNKNATFLPVGTDVNYFKNLKMKKFQKNSKPTILAFGRDKDRDYKTFNEAISSLDIQGVIVSSRENLFKLEIPKNIQVIYDLPSDKLREEIKKSDIIVIPIKKVRRAAGQLSLLDSLASERPVIVANIEGLTSTYLLKDDFDCLLYEPENSADLKKQILKLLKDPGLAMKISLNGSIKSRNYSTSIFANKLSHIIINTFKK